MNTENLQVEFNNAFDRATRLRNSLMSELSHLFSEKGITLGVPLEGRVKTWSSVEEKFDRKSIQDFHIDEIDDLVGVRVILLFKRDLSIVDNILRNTLELLIAEDTGERLNEAQFGYQSKHYIVKIPKSWLQVPSYTGLGDLKVEIQVRTIAQHTWAAASHKLQYKNEDSVPSPLRRSINRVSALLEMVDLEFDRLLDEKNEYISQQLENENLDETLNVDLVESVLNEILPSINKKETEDFADLLEDLKHFGINTVTHLRNLLTQNMIHINERERQEVNKKSIDGETTKNTSFHTSEWCVWVSEIKLVKSFFQNSEKAEENWKSQKNLFLQ